MQTINVVVVPSPFKETIAETAAVPISTLTGSPFAKVIKNFVMGSNRPAFSIMEKNKIANNSIIAVVEVLVSPFTVQSPIMLIWSQRLTSATAISFASATRSRYTPADEPTSVKASGTSTSAVKGCIFFVMTKTRNTIIMVHAKMVRNISISSSKIGRAFALRLC